ncbi:hypothetical protein BUALT_Bualt02G0058700 [Buddleja alternifolia]|uniref:SOSEKI DIX-like domain-containing protein n=1 Tax=Buddleja alternifolia TaxID=168488 RepID=A0AAV6Y4W4_9LAMI|nr:hypothetical protein BUALT_Bualt02G0058700 [Buddleja alternifolia]
MAVPTSKSGRMTTEFRLWRSDQQREIINIGPAPAPAPDERNNIVWKTEEPGPPQLIRKSVPVLSYKNGFVWHDLSDNDFIYPAHGNHDYVLKGSELLDNTMVPPPPPETLRNGAADNLHRRRRNQSSSSIDELYSVYKAESCGTSAATQTHYNRRRRPPAGKESQCDEIENEISPPPSDSSPETLETLMKADGRLTSRHETPAKEDPTASMRRVERGGSSSKSSVLMQLISCGNLISFRDCGAGSGMGLIRATRGWGSGESGRVKLEEREYFSGSIMDDENETKKGELVTVTVPAGGLKSSTSYNADR